MDKSLDTAGFAALLVTIRLIQRLVLQRTLSVEAAKEMIDAALLDAEKILGNSPQGAAVRELLDSYLQDIRNTRDV